MTNTHDGYKLRDDPMRGRLNQLIVSGEVEVIDPDILGLPGGCIEFRYGDQSRIVKTADDSGYEREWPSRDSHDREAARRLLEETKRK